MLSYFGDREARILVLGLDNAGKTTILCEWWRRKRGDESPLSMSVDDSVLIARPIHTLNCILQIGYKLERLSRPFQVSTAGRRRSLLHDCEEVGTVGRAGFTNCHADPHADPHAEPCCPDACIGPHRHARPCMALSVSPYSRSSLLDRGLPC